MLKVVFDTVVFVRTLINPHNDCGRAVFEHFASYRLFLSPPLIREILEVLHREELTRLFQTLPNLDLHRVIELLGGAEIVDVGSSPQYPAIPKTMSSWPPPSPPGRITSSPRIETSWTLESM